MPFGLLPPGPGRLGGRAGCSAPPRSRGHATPSTVVPSVQIADPACEFTGAAYTGPFSPIANGKASCPGLDRHRPRAASYRIEVPPHWNGTLVMFAHGYRGTGNEVWVDDPWSPAFPRR